MIGIGVLLLLVVPIIELAVILQVADAIGVLETIGILAQIDDFAGDPGVLQSADRFLSTHPEA